MIRLWDFFFIIILAVNSFCCLSSTPPRCFSSPYSVTYEPNDELFIITALQHIPEVVTNYVLHFITDDCSNDIIQSTHEVKESCVHPDKRRGTIPTNLEIEVRKKLNNERSITINLELYSDRSRCSTKKILDGVREIVPSNVKNTCIKSGSTKDPCKIYVDFKGKCEEMQTITSCNFIEGYAYTCGNTARQTLANDTIHQWYQQVNDTYIGVIPATTAARTKFIIKLAKFDNNTYIFSTMQSKNPEKMQITPKKKIIIYNKDIADHNITNTIQYSETKEIEFDCRDFLSLSNYSQVCLISPTENYIQTFNTTTFKRKLNMADNSSQLCCLFYIINNGPTNRTITRFVEKYTLLIYESSLNDLALHSSAYIYYYVIASVIGLVFLSLLMCIAIKKLCPKKSGQDELIGLNTIDNSNAVLYAELDIQSRESRHLKCTEESPYAEIIGVLKPPP